MDGRKRWPYVVLGGGLAGLTAAWHLLPEPVLVIEKENMVGGVCRTVRRGGFTFDYTGHLLHFKHPGIRQWVFDLLGENVLTEYHRKAWIYVYGRWVHYPFQVHLHDLPADVAYECLNGFIRLLLENPTPHPGDSFQTWILHTFGSGIANHFMFPYNRKFWHCDLQELTTDWVSWSIPRPDLQDVLKGSLGIADKDYGYNPKFWYPREGGIQVLPDAIAKNLSDIVLGVGASRVFWKERIVSTSDGNSYPYQELIATLPLPTLVNMLHPPVPILKREASKLKALTVLNYNLGIRGTPPVDAHWVYFPEKHFVFYRVGIASAFSPNMAPQGTYSLYVELTLPESQEFPEPEKFRSSILQGLLECQLLSSENDIVIEYPLIIHPAYVIFDRSRKEAVAKIRTFLSGQGIYTVGRFAEWEYYSMDDTMDSARRLALKLRSQKT